jgi:peptidoglycan/LPS O-acetylase OafA/YrhL
VVVVRHTLNAVAMPDGSRHAILASPLGLLLSADGAVRLFFVLSGWVLAASLARGSGLAGALRFWVRRVFRIHPPYVAAVLFAWLAAFLYAASYAGAADRPA